MIGIATVGELPGVMEEPCQAQQLLLRGRQPRLRNVPDAQEGVVNHAVAVMGTVLGVIGRKSGIERPQVRLGNPGRRDACCRGAHVPEVEWGKRRR